MTDHVKMPPVAPIVRYTATGSQTTFAYPFPIFAEDNLAVSLNGARQASGYTVSGEGLTEGGTVTFSAPPAAGTLVTLARDIAISRVSDFVEGAEFSTRALNTELDTLVAALQQIERDQASMLRYPVHETPGVVELPARAARANMAMGYDSDGNPTAVPYGLVQASPSFTASGAGAISRSLSAKLNEAVSVKDFGAVGDGIVDDTNAFLNALAARNCVYVPTGTYLITGTVVVPVGRALYGLGDRSVIKCAADTFNALELRAGYTTIRNLKIEGGDAAIKLYGHTSECVENHLHDLHIVGPKTGLLLDGYTDTNKPCYWNSFNRILIEQPLVDGVRLTRTGAGDTPNANVFSRVRVYSKSAPTSGHGFYVEHGAHANVFTDCEANVNGPTAQACFRVGAGGFKTLL
ncbi:MAG TPA: glycosyl hydrolase family 28-related protein, partial [Alphaproteobacteria bacterium]|nr:glycosyl hydrolase family 28-related protein [Alphaproteobacteria bacterium]